MNTAVAIAPDQPVTAIQVRKPPEIRVVSDPIAVLDTARFEHMQRIANVMAHSNLIPDALCTEKDEKGDKVYLPIERVTANCFLVVNQAVRWNMDPFAVAQCVSVVHGKLCYEGKLIAAVIEGKLGFELEYEIEGTGDSMKVVVSATRDGKPVLDSKGKPKVAEGTVGEWKTEGRGSPWNARGGHPRMLRYRGAREWSRIHSPGLILGVYSDDEMEDLNAAHRARFSPSIVPSDQPPAPPPVEQIAHQPQEAINVVPVSGPVEDLVEVKVPENETVEWTDEAVVEEQVVAEAAASAQTSSDDGPPLPPDEEPTAETGAETTAPTAQEVNAVGQHTAQQATTAVVDDFPGDKPAPKSTDDGLDIPASLRRTKPVQAPADEFNVEEWLQGLSDELAGCEGLEELTEIQQKRVTPHKGKIARDAFARAHSMIMETFERISEAEGGEGV
ncbi:MAG TPA: hypothetical protein VNZ94_00345 [Xanthobacteraceae bacterium]|nr:hypothetical protein [Xanthobacteraceae bacterium]